MIHELSHYLAIGTVCVAGATYAQSLKLGDPAPAIRVGEWVKGEGITGFERGNIYVVEFWATWCPPCITSIPHLTKLQSEYKDRGVHFIGATQPDQRGNSRSRVGEFVETQGDKMAYNVAWDADGSIYESYMVGAQQGTIPTAFVVDRDGRLAWLGHPMAMDRPLALIAGGGWDLEKYQEGSAIYERAQRIFESGDFDEANVLADELIGDYEKLFGGDAHYLKAMIYWNQSLGDKVIAEFDVLISEFPDFLGDDGPYLKFSTLLNYDHGERAMALGRELISGRFHDDADRLGLMAWAIATTPIDGLDLDLALVAATRADELHESKDADTIDTLARVYFELGEIERAIVLQTRAIDLEADPQRRGLFEKTLEEFTTARP